MPYIQGEIRSFRAGRGDLRRDGMDLAFCVLFVGRSGSMYVKALQLVSSMSEV
jgi:hypothetical protein